MYNRSLSLLLLYDLAARMALRTAAPSPEMTGTRQTRATTVFGRKATRPPTFR